VADDTPFGRLKESLGLIRGGYEIDLLAQEFRPQG
jgi:hypothetical protein